MSNKFDLSNDALESDQPEHDPVADSFEYVANLLDTTLDHVGSPGMRSRVDRLLSLAMTYRSGFKAAADIIAVDRLGDGDRRVAWAAQSMKQLMEAGVHDEQLAWEICQWGWPESISAEQAQQLVDGVKAVATLITGNVGTSPPPPPDFGPIGYSSDEYGEHIHVFKRHGRPLATFFPDKDQKNGRFFKEITSEEAQQLIIDALAAEDAAKGKIDPALCPKCGTSHTTAECPAFVP